MYLKNLFFAIEISITNLKGLELPNTDIEKKLIKFTYSLLAN